MKGRMVFVSLCLSALVLFGWMGVTPAKLRTGLEPMVPIGPGTLMDALDPALRKWYIPQELYQEYQWEGWEYSNYAKEHYRRYTDILLEGTSFYDMYGSYITKGWALFDWTQEQPGQYGSRLYKNPRYRSWFDNVLVSSSSKGQYFSAITIGNEIRTTLTPLTFSKPAFNGAQWDFLSDKYAFTALASRISIPGLAAPDDYAPGADLTHFTNLYGFRGTVQLGGYALLGATYVNANHGNSATDFGMNSLKGVLGGPRNAGNVGEIVIQISDDSPEETEGVGALLYAEEILIDGVRANIKPFVEGGIRRGGLLEANGSESIKLKYDISSYTDYDYKLIKKIDFVLVLSNDYRVDVTSNLQTNTDGEPVFLTVTRAEGNVKDGANQRFVRFRYGLPTGNEIFGLTFEINDLSGFSLRAEYDINRRFRRFPNQNYQKHALDTDRSAAFYVTASQISYPWFAYGELFSMDYDYSTTMFIGDSRGDIDYEDEREYLFEFVEDNDDQDRYPDWDRRDQPPFDREVFPGLDENNDLVSDFNQNDNLQPDYKEPFLKYNVDPPEFLFGMDMNNNTVVDRFENDDMADYPYKRDHRGYNVYGGGEIVPDVKLKVGHLHEWLLSRDKRSTSTYALFTLDRSFPDLGKLQVFDMVKMVKDNIEDDLYQWVQPPLSTGVMQPFDDPLVARNTVVNTSYLQFDFIKFRNFNFINKAKYETYNQRNPERTGLKDSWSLGLISKLDYTIPLGNKLVVKPRWKSMYRRDARGGPETEDTKELSEIGFLILQYPLYKGTLLEVGTEGTLFYNLMDKPVVPTPTYVDDYKGAVVGVQFSNRSDYLGYNLTANVGFRWERRSFEDQVEVNTVMFLRMYAGASD